MHARLLIFGVPRKIKFTHGSAGKQCPGPFARSCKYLSGGVCLLFAVAKGSGLRVHTDSPRALFLIDVCPGHFALIARESRRNDCARGDLG